MKNKLFKILLTTGLLTMGVAVNAETATDVSELGSETEVVVGNVAATEYNVEIQWDDPTFDWVYDYENEEFGWEPAKRCVGTVGSDFVYSPENDVELTVEEAFNRGYEIYVNEECTERATEIDDETGYYYLVKRDGMNISIFDFTENGRVEPSVAWNADSKYNNVLEKFEYYTLNKCTELTREYFAEGGEIIHQKDENDNTISLPIYTDANCTEEIEFNTDSELEIFPDGYKEGYYLYVGGNIPFNPGVVPIEARIQGLGGIGMFYDKIDPYLGKNGIYELKLNLENDPEKEVVTPTAGETIGTITITIDAVN